MMIKIIISIRHASAANAPLLPPPPPRCRRISKRAAATAKIALPLSCRLCHQAGHCHHAAAAATSANARQPPRYHCLQNKKVILLTNLIFTTMVTAAHSNDCRATRQWQWQCCYLQLPRIALMLRSDKRDVNSSINPYLKWEKNERTHWHTKNLHTSAVIRIILVCKIICIVTPF